MAEGEKSDEEVSQLFTDRADCFFLWGKYDRKLIMNHLHKLQISFSCIVQKTLELNELNVMGYMEK